MDADFVNYSLRDYSRALAEYRKIIEDYPDTDAAIEARGRIKAILDAERNARIERTEPELIINAGI